ncbi:Hypothetical predicted protein [Paramuricea clavata]|uniref:Uncharacterized protein n=1 Tax=Paramuricea clavata TaxID=317549 RepID=A0A6S7GDN2_PARCT|nr:Hypothetical predicted protein [Paramuricea clavata]
MVNDLNISDDTVKFVDDTTIWEIVFKCQESNSALPSQITESTKWASENNMKLTPTKTKEVRVGFSPRDPGALPPITIDGHDIVVAPHAKLFEWEEHYFNRVWPKWKDGMHNDMKEKIKNIGAYYNQTTNIVTDQLKRLLGNTTTIDEEIKVWEKWINIWSQFTLESFLESNIDAIKAKVPEDSRQDLDMATLAKLLPWSNDAVRGYAVFTYIPFLHNSLTKLKVSSCSARTLVVG